MPTSEGPKACIILYVKLQRSLQLVSKYNWCKLEYHQVAENTLKR